MNLKCTILLITALCFGSEMKYTGPSTCFIKLVPVAASSNGVILFKTSFRINLTGGSYEEPMEIGWLAASASGVWEYHRSVYLTFDDGTVATQEDSMHIKKFESPFRFDETDEVLMRLVKKYAINERINKNTGRGAVSWTKYGIYQSGKRISRSNVVTSVLDVKSNPGKGNPTKCTFYRSGVAMFNSKLSEDDQTYSSIIEGAEFFRGAMYNGVEVWALYSIDGLVFIDR